MSETAKEREERMVRAAAGRDRRRPPADGVPEKRATTAKRTKPVRLTVDLTPPMHRRLKSWTVSIAAEELDVADVPAAEVVRSLIDLLTNVHRDKDLRQALTAAVLADLRQNRQ